jgi:hypothetical protein
MNNNLLHMLPDNTFFIREGRAYIKVCNKMLLGILVTYAYDTADNTAYVFDGDEMVQIQ